MKKLLRVILVYILLGIIVQLLFGSQYAILPQSLIAPLMGLIGSLGSNILFVIIAIAISVYLVKSFTKK